MTNTIQVQPVQVQVQYKYFFSPHTVHSNFITVAFWLVTNHSTHFLFLYFILIVHAVHKARPKKKKYGCAENGGQDNGGPENAGISTCTANAVIMSIIGGRNVVINNVRTNTESVQCRDFFFERAYFAPKHTQVTINTSPTSSVMWPFDT